MQTHPAAQGAPTGVQIEHIEGARNIGAVIDVPGVDAAFLRPCGLSGSMGKPGQINDAEVQACVAGGSDACRQKGTPLGISAMNAGTAHPLMAQGYPLVTVGTDALSRAESAVRSLTAPQGGAACKQAAPDLPRW